MQDDLVQWKLEGNNGPLQMELDFKKYNKLAVCGCSISDRTKVRYAWGDYLSASLGIDYLHLAGGAGSDKRNIRLLVQAIQQGEVDEKTLVLFQPAEVTRREMPSHVDEEWYADHVADVNNRNLHGEGRTPILDKSLTGQIVARYKIDSCHWTTNEKDKAMQLAYQEKPGCMNVLFDAEVLSVYWYMLQGLCDSKNIKLVMVQDWDRGWQGHLLNDQLPMYFGDKILPEWYNKDNWINFKDFMTDEERRTMYALQPPHDTVHFGEAGHVVIADGIEKLLKERGIL